MDRRKFLAYTGAGISTLAAGCQTSGGRNDTPTITPAPVPTETAEESKEAGDRLFSEHLMDDIYNRILEYEPKTTYNVQKGDVLRKGDKLAVFSDSKDDTLETAFYMIDKELSKPDVQLLYEGNKIDWEDMQFQVEGVYSEPDRIGKIRSY